MRQIIIALLGATALSIACVPGVLAADLPVKAPAALAAYNWSGFYVGGNVGYGWGQSSDPSVTVFDGSGTGLVGYFAAAGNVTPNLRPKGAIGGVQAGYDWMVSPNWLAGFVADFQASGVKASGANLPIVPGFNPANLTNRVATDWFGTVRAKVGLAQNNLLYYLTGGLAYGDIKTSGSLVCTLVCALNYVGANNSTKVGWTAGAGFDYGITRNWIVGLEYLYVSLGSSSYTETAATGIAPLTTITISNRDAINIVRLTANYKF